MSFNPFIGQSREWLETELSSAQTDLARGKTLSSYGSEGQSASKLVQMTPMERIEKLLYALTLIDPVTYPPASIRRVTRTQVKVYPDWTGGTDENA